MSGRTTVMSSERGEGEGGDTSAGGFDVNRLEVEGDDEDDEPHFLGDAQLLSHDDAGTAPSRRMMVFQGMVEGHRAVVLLDLGANASFVSQAWARRHGLAERPMKTATEITTATGRTHAATTQVDSADVHVVGKRHRTSLIVAPLGTYDVILGTPWFKATHPQFDWTQWTCNGHSVYSQGGRSVGHPGRTSRRLQSVVVGGAHQTRSWDRLMKEYSDVFASKLPRRVLPVRER